MWLHWLDRALMPSKKTLLIVFVKAPRLGFVKTRLAQSLGDEEALKAFRWMVEKLLKNLEGWRDLQLRFAPSEAEEEIRPWLQPQWQASPQSEGGLGERLIDAFEDGFRLGAEEVIIIGSDCPHIQQEDIAAASVSLDHHDLVLGPSTDGGYWLVGLKQSRPELFEDINWSTETVLKETLGKAEQAGLSVELLRELEDIDTAEEWERLERSG